MCLAWENVILCIAVLLWGVCLCFLCCCMWSSGQSCQCVHFVGDSKGLKETHKSWFSHLISFYCCENVISARLNQLYFFWMVVKLPEVTQITSISTRCGTSRIYSLITHTICYAQQFTCSASLWLCRDFMLTSNGTTCAKGQRIWLSSTSNNLAAKTALSYINSTGHL